MSAQFQLADWFDLSKKIPLYQVEQCSEQMACTHTKTASILAVVSGSKLTQRCAVLLLSITLKSGGRVYEL